ncbi:phage tail-collar fiber domain-containing protein [Cytobacillus massiliigabonensis]|uniref:phage tail-collar fiber domain-containing protein n=1 Tax=Cytobacillus massiliigabonensis TaxID=1871011 RepID=UPI000C830EC0|nr:phage tail protein [Cytobacillus massiliigabonensis]
MAEYTGMVLTKKGKILQAKAESGVRLNFTKVAIGDGTHGSQNIEEIEVLQNPIKDLWITGINVEFDRCKVSSAITNEGLNQGFYLREMGLYAYDPDEGEILFAVALAKEADYLPAVGGTTAINSEFEITIFVANASNITANISNVGYVSREEFDELVLRFNVTSEKTDKNTEDISKIGLRLTNLEQSYSNNFTSNQFTEDLNTLVDVVVTRGVYDSVNKRLVI